MRRLAAALSLAVAAIAPLAGQRGTADVLNQARQYYEHLETERALLLLRRVVSPGWPFEVTSSQRAEAYKYLGASFVLTGKPDSAVLYFRAALERDPFTDLDPAVFTPAQRSAFAEARDLTFNLGLGPAPEGRIDPRTERIRFKMVTTHQASVEATVQLMSASNDSSRATLLHGPSEGVRDLTWNGLLTGGHLAPPGRYRLSVVAKSGRLDQTDTAYVYFDLRHETPPLEDTLPALTGLLPEQRPAATANRELVKGFGVAAATLLVAGALASDTLGNGTRTGAVVVAVAASVTGIVSFLRHRAHRDIPENIAANARKEEARAQANHAIQSRNAEKTARTILTVAPAAGVGP